MRETTNPMTVYVDDMYAPFGRMKMCHMIADSHEELVGMAVRIRVQPKWIQDEGTSYEHFDVCMSARRQAVAAGAVEITLFELATMTKSRRDDGTMRGLFPLGQLRKQLIEEAGLGCFSVAIWRRGHNPLMWDGTVGEFLERSDNQSGTWLIDGGWGGPPGPIEVDWIDGEWIDQGHLGERRRLR